MLSKAGNHNLVYYDGHRLVVPNSHIKSLLKELHASHCGFQKTYALAKQLYFWPGMRNDIIQTCNSCSSYQSLLPSQAHTPIQEKLPSTSKGAPMKEVATDLFHHNGKNYLALVDSCLLYTSPSPRDRG